MLIDLDLRVLSTLLNESDKYTKAEAYICLRINQTRKTNNPARYYEKKWGWVHRTTQIFVDRYKEVAKKEPKSSHINPVIAGLPEDLVAKNEPQSSHPVKTTENTAKLTMQGSHTNPMFATVAEDLVACIELNTNTNTKYNYLIEDENFLKANPEDIVGDNGLTFKQTKENFLRGLSPENKRARKLFIDQVLNNVNINNEQYTLLGKKVGLGNESHWVRRLSEYMTKTGKDYSDHYSTILSWYEKDLMRERTPRRGKL